ncbi:Hypothetical protein PBC10988_40080 [Planctomycetales bacterium 10988]|nr:Hypothetical protein PBC10988_40080 [Planctomycetales bacterium 10988]
MIQMQKLLLIRLCASHRLRRILVCSLTVFLIGLLENPSYSQEKTISQAENPTERETDSQQKFRELLRDANLNWYDSKKDQIRPLEVQPQKQAAPTNWNKNWAPNWNFDFGEGFGVVNLFEVMIWSILSVVLMLIAYMLIKLYLKSEALTKHSDGDSLDDGIMTDVERVEALPVQVRREVTDFLAEATRLYKAGNFRDAILYLYSHQLLMLDRQHIIRLTKGKTNRQYLKEVLRNGSQPLMQTLEPSLVAFEEVFFGNHPLGRERFEACWNRLTEFNRLVQQRVGI